MDIRRAVPGDRSRILEISAQIWDGEDYIHWVIDDWYADAQGEFVVAEIDDRVVAFSHRSWLFPGYAWIQGIRTDPAAQGRGVGRAITEHFMEGARQEGADRIGLSTYIDNEASIHIIESYRFERVATYVYTESTQGQSLASTRSEKAVPHVREVERAEAAEFIRSSAFLRTCDGRIPWIWKMYPFDETEEILFGRIPYWRGVQQEGRIMGYRRLHETDPPLAGGALAAYRPGVGRPVGSGIVAPPLHRRHPGRT